MNIVGDARGKRVRLPGHFAGPVHVEEASLYDGLVILQVRTSNGDLRRITVNPEDLEAALAAALPTTRPPVSPEDFFLLIESARIRLAYAHDPHFAVNLTGIAVLPHQLEAVYQRMLPQVLLRFLLADDPGAGKTIMSGLLIKELALRGIVDRVLVLCPAPLTIQWQDELWSKFDERFEVLTSERVKGSLAGNPWEAYPRCIASMDFAKRDEVRDGVLAAQWDMVVIDEAHKCSARTDGDKVSKTERYDLAERLSRTTERLLLLTATPHQGNADQFTHFLRLLDPDQFVNLEHDRKLIQLDRNPWYLRRMKEDLKDFEGRDLFPPRLAVTQRFELTLPEYELYVAVTDYINTYLPRQTGKRRNSVALARIVLQRRLASSLGAISQSLERRRDRFADVLTTLEPLSPVERERKLAELRLIDDPEQDADDRDEEDLDEIAGSATAAERMDELARELEELQRLVALATETREAGQEAKLNKLEECLKRGEFAELKDGRGKLLIFTEHRATLDYLRGKLRGWGYTTTQIHGGMSPVERKQRQLEFQTSAQICIATEAAGEGINLQFCHLMINYDMPWNPNRLEQRMGRIHRIGQEFKVYVFNFVATNTVEGRILDRLLEKLEEIKAALGERVYDVVGDLLKLNQVNLEDMLREAAYNPGRIEDIEAEIARIDPKKLSEYEKSVGIALAKSHVDLSRLRGDDWRSSERRLMPEYVEQFFERASERTGLHVERRADSLWRVEHVPQRFRADDLASVVARGRAEAVYRKLTFRKEDRQRSQNLDAELVAPTHPLFAAVDEVLRRNVASCLEGAARFVDPFSQAPYRLHFLEVVVEGGTLEVNRLEPARASLIAVTEGADGALDLAAPDILHDLTPSGDTTDVEVTPERVDELQIFVMARAQHPMAEGARAERTDEVRIRRDYLAEAFEVSISKAQQSYFALAQRVVQGEEGAKLARDEAKRRVDELELRRKTKLASLDSLAVIVQGPIRYLGTAAVDVTDAPVGPGMRRDDAVEAAAMKVAMDYERAQGWEVTDVSRLYDGSGFDLRSVGPTDEHGDRPLRRIEVKGRAGADLDVELTPNEWLQATRHGATYWLYVVWNAKTAPVLRRIHDPAATLGPQVKELREVRGYHVPAQAIIEGASA